MFNKCCFYSVHTQIKRVALHYGFLVLFPVLSALPQNAIAIETSYANSNNAETFISLREIRTASWAETTFALAIGYLDVNSDGLEDVFVSSGDGSENRTPMELYINNGDGTYTLRQDLFTNSNPGAVHPRKAVVADYNGDGRNDVFVVDHGYDKPPFPGSYPLLFLNTGSGLQLHRAFTEYVGFHHSATAADIDGDGDVDIFVSDSAYQPFFLINDGSAGFTYSTLGEDYIYLPMFTSELIDVDGDNYVDLIVAGHEQDGMETRVYWGSASGTYGGNNYTSIPAVVDQGVVVDIDAGDIDADGDLDLVIGRTGSFCFYCGWKVQVLEQVSNRQFTDTTAQSFPDALQGPDNTVNDWVDWWRLRDLDGDGYADLVRDNYGLTSNPDFFNQSFRNNSGGFTRGFQTFNLVGDHLLINRHCTHAGEEERAKVSITHDGASTLTLSYLPIQREVAPLSSCDVIDIETSPCVETLALANPVVTAAGLEDVLNASSCLTAAIDYENGTASHSVNFTTPDTVNGREFEPVFYTPDLAMGVMYRSYSFFTQGLTLTLRRLPTVQQVGPYSLVAASLPSSRSVQVGDTATAFATVINAGTEAATGCSIAPVTSIPAMFSYQTTDPATNALTGSPDTPVNIAAGAYQTYLLAFTPTAAFAPIDVELSYDCVDTQPAGTTLGVNTLLMSASDTPVADIVAMAATPTADGILNIPGDTGANAFVVATANVGVSGSITASADTGSASLPVTLFICETNPATGVCLAPPATSVATTIAGGATPTFAIFVNGSGTIPFDPANNRIFVRFKDSGDVTRGSTSVAVRTQ